MIPSSITLHSASHRITAQLGSQLLNLTFHPPSGGAIPPGNYSLSRPMHNSVYGTFALLSLTRPAAGAAGWINQGWINPRLHSGWVNQGSLGKNWIGSDWINPRAGNRGGVNRDWVNQGWLTQAGADWVQNPMQAANQPGVFVVVERPLAGRNSIVIVAGFAELMRGLEAAGGATVTVA